MNRVKLFALSSLLISSAAVAEESNRLASNGVLITVNSDEFANRYEYSAPTINFRVPKSRINSFALVYKVSNRGQIGETRVGGTIVYSGDWQYYDKAIFKGGENADFVSIKRDVLSCRGGCTYTEEFRINISSSQISKYAENGILKLQLRSKTSNQAILEIPISYFAAINEVSVDN